MNNFLWYLMNYTIGVQMFVTVLCDVQYQIQV